MHCAACGRASALRGGAEVLGEGVSQCGGGSWPSAGNGLRGGRGTGCEVGGECIGAAWGVEVLREGVSLCGDGSRPSAGNGV